MTDDFYATFKSGAAITKGARVTVAVSSGEIVVNPAGASDSIGIAQRGATAAGELIGVKMYAPQYRAIASAAIALGAPVDGAASGKVATSTPGAAFFAIAAATAADQEVVLVKREI